MSAPDRTAPLPHMVRRGRTKWECSCGEQFVAKREADQHLREWGRNR